MPTPDPRVDAYIDAAAPFAQPILRSFRALVHAACPEVVETMKWQMPHFERKGILCHMAAFKAHCAFRLWNGAQIVPGAGDAGMGHFGKVTSRADLPSDEVLLGYLRAQVAMNEAGTRNTAKKPATPKPTPVAPVELLTALDVVPVARASWDGFPPSHRREYIQWILEAKSPETRQRRVEQAVAWMAEGKPRNWKYR